MLDVNTVVDRIHLTDLYSFNCAALIQNLNKHFRTIVSIWLCTISWYWSVSLHFSGWPRSDEKPHSCLFKIPGLHWGRSEDYCPEPANHHQVIGFVCNIWNNPFGIIEFKKKVCFIVRRPSIPEKIQILFIAEILAHVFSHIMTLMFYYYYQRNHFFVTSKVCDIFYCFCFFAIVLCRIATPSPARTATARTSTRMAWLNIALPSMLEMHVKW